RVSRGRGRCDRAAPGPTTTSRTTRGRARAWFKKGPADERTSYSPPAPGGTPATSGCPCGALLDTLAAPPLPLELLARRPGRCLRRHGGRAPRRLLPSRFAQAVF